MTVHLVPNSTYPTITTLSKVRRFLSVEAQTKLSTEHIALFKNFIGSSTDGGRGKVATSDAQTGRYYAEPIQQLTPRGSNVIHIELVCLSVERGRRRRCITQSTIMEICLAPKGL